VRRLRLDFETASFVDLKAAGAHRYAEDITTEVLSLTYRVQGSARIHLWTPESTPAQSTFLADLCIAEDVLFVAHNAGFEKAIWRNIMVAVHGFPDIPNKRWHCTQAVCAMKALPQDLDRAMAVLRLPHQKDKAGSTLVKSLSKINKKTGMLPPRTPEIMERIYEYNRSDIIGTEALDDRVGAFAGSERQVWLLDQRINERGVRLDMDFVRAAQEVVARASAPLLHEFSEITGGLKPTQVAKFLAWLHGQGVHLDNMQKGTLDAIFGDSPDEDDDAPADSGGDEAVASGVPDYDDIPDAPRRALFIRWLVGSASIKKLARMSQVVCADGRARGIIQYHGAAPGLWAGRLFQPQNFPRGTLSLDKKPPPPQVVVDAILTRDPEFVEMMLGPPVQAVVSSLRHALIPADDSIFVAGDYSGIQARTVLAMAGQYDKVELMASGADVYMDMAMSIYKDRTLTKEKDPEARQTGKNTVLGLGFQMGAPKFRDKYARHQPIEFSENVVHVYRKEWAPKVPFLWYGLNDASAKAVWDKVPVEAYGIEYRLEDGWLTCRLPSGRKIWYFNPTPVRRPMPWDETDIRRGWTYNAMKFGQWKTIHAFGGLLTENAVMGCQRDLMTHAGFNLERNGFRIVLNVHDEWVTEPLRAKGDPDKLKAEMKQIMGDIPQWAKAMRIPVVAEVWSGERYRK
jgi:DNA polymerase